MIAWDHEGAAALFEETANMQTLICNLAALLERPHIYDATGTTEDANAWKEVCSKTWTPRASGTYDWSVRFSGMVQIAAGFESETRLVIDGSYYHTLSWEDDGRWLGCHGEAIVALDDSEHTVAVEMRSSTIAQTASIKEVALVARLLAQ
jgi:hypothetical protein